MVRSEINDLRIQEEAPDVKTVKRESPNPEIKKITEKFDHVFQGIGKIRDKKNDQDFYAKFSVKPEAVPVAQKPRPVAYYLPTQRMVRTMHCRRDFRGGT